jgi:hypothetical protein
MIVLFRRCTLRHEAQISRHAEMNDQATVLDTATAIEQQVLSAPAYCHHLLPRQRLAKRRRQRQAQARRAHHRTENPLPLDLRLEPAPTNLHLR